MKLIHLRKAQSLTEREISSVAIVIDRQFPVLDGTKRWEKNQKSMMDRDAKLLVDTLCETLPQGTVDAVLIQLLERKRSLLVTAQKK